MEIETTAHHAVSIVRVIGYLDTRASTAFERKMVELLQGGTRLFAVDFTRLDMITSAGIRVLMMVIKRLGSTDRVVLWGLNDQVKVVFSIAGLADVFQVFDTEQAAIDRLEKPPAPEGAAPGQLSKMARLATRLLGGTDQVPMRRRPSDAVSKMTDQVSQALTKRSHS